MPRVTAIGVLVLHDQEAAKERIHAAYEEARFVAQTAAASLGISYRHLARLVDTLDMAIEIDRRRAAAGISAPPRPPRGSHRTDRVAVRMESGPPPGLETVDTTEPIQLATA